jgi:hypothetical protein
MTLDVDLLRHTERLRVQALVQADVAAAEPLHASDYQLINPGGMALTKAEYLGAISSGGLRYRVFEPATEIAAWGDDQVAVLRYQARIALEVPDIPVAMYWHTDCYEFRDQRWQAVWSQATKAAAQSAPPG